MSLNKPNLKKQNGGRTGPRKKLKKGGNRGKSTPKIPIACVLYEKKNRLNMVQSRWTVNAAWNVGARGERREREGGTGNG